MHALTPIVALTAGAATALHGSAAQAFDVETIVIERAAGDQDWPFTAERGELQCIEFRQRRYVFFVPEKPDGDEDSVMVAVSTNPLELFANLGDRQELRQFADFEELIRRMAPIYETGLALCDKDDAGQ
jgi:hypothetical protein